MNLRGTLIALALSPASMELKRQIRARALSAEAIRVGCRRDTAVAGLAAAWLYWLSDGNPAGAELDPSLDARDWLLAARIADGAAPPIQFRSNGRDTAELRIDKRILALPEGDGGYYRRLEIDETGESRMLPDRIIDECIDFVDSVSEVLHENRPFFL